MQCKFCMSYKILIHRAYDFIAETKGYLHDDKESLLNDLTVAMCDASDPTNVDPASTSLIEELNERIENLEDQLKKAKQQIIADRAWRGR